MGSIKRGGVRFSAYPNDHLPRHVHAYVGEVMVILELIDQDVRLANRVDQMRPNNGKRSDVKKALRVAAKHFEELVELWEGRNG